MVIAILSDIHDNLPNLSKSLTWCKNQQIKKIIFCGDTTTLDTLTFLATNFPGEIFMVKGNVELFTKEKIKKLSNINFQGEIGFAEIDGVRLGFCHEPQKINQTISLAKTPLHFIFYGHTHTPWLEKRGPTTIVNPGNLAGTFHQATFATLNTTENKLKLKILADLK